MSPKWLVAATAFAALGWAIWLDIRASRRLNELWDLPPRAPREDKGMRFTFDGQEYQIEFSRALREGRAPGAPEFLKIKTPTGVEMVENTTFTFPYTSVRIMVVDLKMHRRDWKCYRTATVGCHHAEKGGFSPEIGRKRALTDVGRTLTREFRTQMWLAYHARKD